MRNTPMASGHRVAPSPTVAQRKQRRSRRRPRTHWCCIRRRLTTPKTPKARAPVPCPTGHPEDPVAIAHPLRAVTGGDQRGAENRTRPSACSTRCRPGASLIAAAQAQADGDVLAVKQHRRAVEVAPQRSARRLLRRQCVLPGGRHRGSHVSSSARRPRPEVRGALQSDRLHPTRRAISSASRRSNSITNRPIPPTRMTTPSCC